MVTYSDRSRMRLPPSENESFGVVGIFATCSSGTSYYE